MSRSAEPSSGCNETLGNHFVPLKSVSPYSRIIRRGRGMIGFNLTPVAFQTFFSPDTIDRFLSRDPISNFSRKPFFLPFFTRQKYIKDSCLFIKSCQYRDAERVTKPGWINFQGKNARGKVKRNGGRGIIFRKWEISGEHTYIYI